MPTDVVQNLRVHSTCDVTPDLPARLLAPAGLRWGYLQRQNARLRWACVPGKLPIGSCILVGGFSEFAEKYFETMADLAAGGLTVWFLEWRGQGGSDRPPDHPTRPIARDFVTDADDLAAFAETMVPSPRFLIAHSMGGAIGLLTVARHPRLLHAAALSAPMLGIDTASIPLPIARIMAAAMTWLGLASVYAPGRGPWMQDPQIAANSLTSHDPVRAGIEQAWFLGNPRLRLDGPTFGWVYAALKLCRTLADPALLRRINIPVLIGCASEDVFVDNAAIRHAGRLMPLCRTQILEGARHELFMEVDAIRSPWLAEVLGFLRSHIQHQADSP